MTQFDEQARPWDLACRWRQFRRETRGGGVWHVVDRLLRELIPSRFLRLGSIHIVALPLHALPARSPAVHIRRATDEDVESLVARHDLNSDSLRREFGRGSEVWVAEQAGMPVAYDVCGARRKLLWDWLMLEASERETWSIGIWVAPEARGQGLAGQLRRRVAQEFQERGYVRLLGTISATNKRSIHAFEKLDTEFIGRIDYLRLLSFGIVRFDGRVRAGRWTGERLFTLSIPRSSMEVRPTAPHSGGTAPRAPRGGVRRHLGRCVAGLFTTPPEGGSR